MISSRDERQARGRHWTDKNLSRNHTTTAATISTTTIDPSAQCESLNTFVTFVDCFCFLKERDVAFEHKANESFHFQSNLNSIDFCVFMFLVSLVLFIYNEKLKDFLPSSYTILFSETQKSSFKLKARGSECSLQSSLLVKETQMQRKSTEITKKIKYAI